MTVHGEIDFVGQLRFHARPLHQRNIRIGGGDFLLVSLFSVFLVSILESIFPFAIAPDVLESSSPTEPGGESDDLTGVETNGSSTEFSRETLSIHSFGLCPGTETRSRLTSDYTEALASIRVESAKSLFPTKTASMHLCNGDYIE